MGPSSCSVILLLFYSKATLDYGQFFFHFLLLFSKLRSYLGNKAEAVLEQSDPGLFIPKGGLELQGCHQSMKQENFPEETLRKPFG